MYRNVQDGLLTPTKDYSKDDVQKTVRTETLKILLCVYKNSEQIPEMEARK